MQKSACLYIQILLLCLTIYLTPSQAQKATFESFSLEDGLAGHNASRPAQDIRGMIWVVCDGKLQRFEGDQFVTYPGPPADLSGSGEQLLQVTSFEDSLLLIAGEHHLFLFEPENGKWEAFPFDREYNFHDFKYVSKNVICFIVTKGKSTGNSVVLMFQNREIRPLPALEGKDFKIRTNWISDGEFIIEDDSIVIHVEDGILRKIAYDGTILKEMKISSWNSKSNLARLDSKKLLILDKSTFFITDLNFQELIPHPANRMLNKRNSIVHLQQLQVEPNGSFWACGYNSSLIYYDIVQDTVYNFRNELRLLEFGVLSHMTMDKTGNLWIKTDRGLLKVSFIKFPFSNFFINPASDDTRNKFRYSFRGITGDNLGNIYAAYYIGAVSIDNKDKEHNFLKDQYQWVPFDIYFKNDNIYLNNGNLIDLEVQQRRPVSGSTGEGTQDRGVFAQDDQGRLFRIVTDTLYRLDDRTLPGKWDIEAVLPIPNPVVNFPEAIYYSEKDRKFLIGSRNNLYSYDPHNRKIQTYGKEKWGIPINRIMAIEELSPGVYWMGTDIGLVQFDTRNNQVKQYTTSDGLCNNFICGMLAEGDTALWLGTNNGMSRFAISGEQFVNFYMDDGLTTNEFNRSSYYKARDGRMFFGGMYGINAFYPEEIMESYQRQNEQARLILTRFDKVDEKRGENVREIFFDDDTELHLYHWDRSFEFHYLLTDYTKPQEVRYSYKMKGYEERWSEYSKDNSIRFSSLPAGDYTLMVKAMDHHGMEHPNQMSVKLVVHPPWWKSTLAYIIYAFLIAGLGYTIFRFYMRRLKLQLELEKEHEEAMRLKELDNFKSRLYTNLTHEFRTPLTVILGMTDQVEEDPKQHMEEGLELIRKNGTQLLNLINQLLDLSKLENNVFELQLVQGDIIAYLRYLSDTFKAFARKHKIDLTMYAGSEQVIMDFDPEQFKQIMNNLISNAVKFTPSGGAIEIRAGKEGQNLVIEVKDTGAGINASDISHIFDRFYQADNSESRKWEGSGIGLAHTRELISLMDGTIKVESNADPVKGPTWTCFSILLPIRTADNIPAAGLIDIPEAVGESTSVSKELHLNLENGSTELPQLLIVEDNPDVVAYLVSCLRGDYQIDVAVNGREGLEKAIEGIPDLIISDVMMPEMDGFELCDILKKDERTSHIPVIMLTAKADITSKVEGLERGADAYLYKPFNKKELLVRIEMMIKKKQQLSDYYMRRFKGGLDVETIPPTEEALPIEDAFILKIRDIIETHYTDENFALPDLAKEIGMSRSQLYRKMKALVDTSPSDFIRNYRLGKARILLQEQNLNVSEVAWQVGYKDIAHFSRSYQAAFGENPSELLKK